jgi:transketolase
MEPRDLSHEPDSLYAFHSGAPDADTLERAVAEVEERLADRMRELDQPPPRLAQEPRATRALADAGGHPQRLVDAYGEALAVEAEHDGRLVALDADLVRDTGLVPFRRRFPGRFIECGIAEQDMVSQAGALALAGMLPVVHSFACFLSTRANEQIYNNATEATKVIYVGSLAGLLPGGPGHSHQSVRDISALGAMPGMALLEPCSDEEVAAAVSWAVREAAGPVYLRLVSVPWELPFDPPAGADLQVGRGRVIREGADAVLVAAGPVMLSQAWEAAESLGRQGIAVAVVALPWLRGIDGEWLATVAGDAPVYCLDNHYVSGGQGDAVLAALAEARGEGTAPVRRLGVDSVPACGTNDEVLRAHRLDGAAIAERIEIELASRV